MSWGRRVGVSFAAVIVVVVIFWVWAVDWLVEREIEKRGSLALGARVELDAVDISALPPGIEFLRLQITNPSKPMTNAVEVRRIAGRMDGWALLSGQIVVDLLTVEGIALGTDRETSGAIDGVPPPSASGPMFTLPSFEPPSVETVLAGEKLESLALIQAVRDDIGALETRWRKKLAELPDEETFKAFGERFEQLSKGDLQSALREFESLQRDIERALKLIEDAAAGLSNDVGKLASRIEEARAAPMADLNRLANQYALSPEGVSNLTRQLLGESAQASVAQLLFWGEKLAELTGGDESAVEEASDAAGPDVLVRLARVSVSLDSGEILGEISNISTNQAAFGQPLTVLLASDALEGLERLELRAVLDHVQPEAPSDSVSLLVKGYKVNGVALSRSEAWPVMLAAGRADLDASAALGPGGSLDARVRLALRDARLEAPFPGNTIVVQALSLAIKEVSELDVTMTATGTTQDYEIAIQSNLDRILARAVGGILRRQATRFRDELEERIFASTRGPLQELTGQRRALDGYAREFGERENLGQELLESKPPSVGSSIGRKLKKLF